MVLRRGFRKLLTELPGLHREMSRKLVDVSTRSGRLMRHWRQFVDEQYIVWGWTMVGEGPVQAKGRWQVLLTRVTYTEASRHGS